MYITFSKGSERNFCDLKRWLMLILQLRFWLLAPSLHEKTAVCISDEDQKACVDVSFHISVSLHVSGHIELNEILYVYEIIHTSSCNTSVFFDALSLCLIELKLLFNF